MSGRDEPGPPGELLDFPLREERGEPFSLPLPSPGPTLEPAVPRTASLPDRILSTGADAATVLLLVALALLVAAGARERWPTPSGLFWAAGFGLYLSFFVIVVPLLLFGRTIGMALSNLAAAPLGGSRRLGPRESILRWAGTLLTVLSLGVSLLFTASEPEAPTLADGLSGRPLLAELPPEGP
ncbi:MAG: RDD family protein [Thermoanaerobaculia bacterium]